MPRGRPKGSKNKKTLEREAREREWLIQTETKQTLESVETPSQKEMQEVQWTTFERRYFKGQKYFYIYTNDFTGTKAIFEIVVHTVKPNVLICNVKDDPSFVCIGPEEESLLFSSFDEAKKRYKQIKVSCLYGSPTQEGVENGTRKKRGRPRKNSGIS